MLDPKLQETLDKINTISIDDIKKSLPTYQFASLSTDSINGLSSSDLRTMSPVGGTDTGQAIPALTTMSLTGLTAVQLSAIGGTQGYTLSSGTTGSNINWQSPTYVSSAIGTPMTVGKSGHLELRGEDADVVINGKSMSAWMIKVEERLNILTPNPELEKEWDDLRKLGERYRKLEKKCKEKAEVWKKLKDMPPPAIN